MDVVQTVWLEVLAGFRERQWEFKNQARSNPSLRALTYNKFVSECRRNNQAVERERPLSPETIGQIALPGCLGPARWSRPMSSGLHF